MKLLLQVLEVDNSSSIPQTDINYAIVEITDEVQQYLAKRKALFEVSKTYSDDLAGMRFWGCSFITFHDKIVDEDEKIIDEDERHIFDEQGYWIVPDDFANDIESAECEFTQVVLDGESWYVTANEKDTGVEIKTREIPHDLSKLSA
jgi:hypothetical protein